MSDTYGFDVGVHSAQRWRRIRRAVVLLLAPVLFLEFLGVPHLRTTPGGAHRARYWSVTGLRTIAAGEATQACPLIVLVPMERSLVSYAADAFGQLIPTTGDR